VMRGHPAPTNAGGFAVASLTLQVGDSHPLPPRTRA
jgi:hypothetical protein